MDTSSATEDMTPRSLDMHIQDCWDHEHETDPARAADLIMERLAKDGATPLQVITDHLGIGSYEPAAVLKAIVQQEYARSLSPEDRLIWGTGLKPETAECIMTSLAAATEAWEARDDLRQALAQEDFTALCREVRESTGLTESREGYDDIAASMMLELMPVLDEVLSLGKRGDFYPGTIVHAALAKCYRECLEDGEAGAGVSPAIAEAIKALDEADASATHKAEERLLGAVVTADFTAMMTQIWESGDPQRPEEVAQIMLSRMPALGWVIAGRANLTGAMLGVLALLYDKFVATLEILSVKEDEDDPEGAYQRRASLAQMREFWLETHEEDAGKAAQEILRRMPEAPFIEQSGFTEAYLQAITEGYSALLARRGVSS